MIREFESTEAIIELVFDRQREEIKVYHKRYGKNYNMLPKQFIQTITKKENNLTYKKLTECGETETSNYLEFLYNLSNVYSLNDFRKKIKG